LLRNDSGGNGGGSYSNNSPSQTGGKGANGGVTISYTWPGNNVVLNIISSTFS
jgi:hypothetical protein